MSETQTVRVSPIREQVAEEVRVLLARRKISASELARRMGVTQPYISRRLNGETAMDVDDLALIAQVLGVEVVELLPARLPEGRTVVVAGDARRQTTVPKPDLAKQSRPFGLPHHATPKQSTRRPVRLVPAHA
jgi:transcriptional regulator with XRE-family HTH domain